MTVAVINVKQNWKKHLTIKRHALFQKHLFFKGFYTIGDLFSDARIFLKDVISHIIFLFNDTSIVDAFLLDRRQKNDKTTTTNTKTKTKTNKKQTKGKTDYHCKIKKTLFIQELEPAFNVNVGSDTLMLY